MGFDRRILAFRSLAQFSKIVASSPVRYSPMASKSRKRGSRSDLAKDLWINPRSNLRGPDGNRAWQNDGNISPGTGSRPLELADIALGLKKPASNANKRKKAAADATIVLMVPSAT